MAWLNDPTNLDKSTAAGRLNVVRFLVGDTEATKPQVQDEEINFGLSESQDDVYYAAIYISDSLIAKYARLVTTEIDGDLLIEYSDLLKNYRMLSDDLAKKAKTIGNRLGVGGGGLTTANSFCRYQFNNPPSTEVDY